MTTSTSWASPGRRALTVSLVGPIAVGCCAIGAGVYVAAIDPASAGTYPACAVRSVTGWWCPGCGLTRATYHLLHGDIREALGYHALVIPIVVLLVTMWIAWVMDCAGRRAAWVHRAAIPAWLGLAFVAVVFTILRNLEPFGALRG
ncbi:MAG TPA: DUF2752 domain-containing protein [Ilumatobacteraceae bacterium]|nr:DUF2752 domain-containing protein [Ilumatobacteraceae bacterium]